MIDIRESGLKPEAYSYLIAMTAVVKELNELSKALRKLKSFSRAGSAVAELDPESTELVEKYQSDLLSDGVRLSDWAIEAGKSSSSSSSSMLLDGVVRERLLAMYICAGRGIEAERQLWEMKLVGKEADGDLYDIVLAILASQKEVRAVSRLLARVDLSGGGSSPERKKSLSWLLRGYIKGGHFDDAAETMVRMLDSGLCPEYLDRAAVIQGLRKRIAGPASLKAYLDLCTRLSDSNLIGPCLVYMYINKYKLWVIKML